MQATGRGSAERERHKGFLLVLGLIVRLCSKYTSFFFSDDEILFC